ncbi:tetratricopeptide repeat protein, partial [Streptomyces sp. NPDC000983]|uniref:tetratricopeptide repeat protein n=1 Tax=Streptomyces sp. NPDC000983 TaxID=3154373 RepID=UPI00332B506C
GHPDRALPPTEEAVQLYRALVKTNPAHLPDLAGSLNNLGVRHSELGHPDRALPPTEEAVQLYRALVKTNPAHLPDLASSLNNLSSRYNELGQSPEKPWTEALSDASPSNAAILLLYRSTDANPGDLNAAAWLANAEQAATTAGLSELLQPLHEEARRHRNAIPEEFDRHWHQLTGAPPPPWLTINPELLELSRAWIRTDTYEAERDHLAAHPELLSPEADVCVEEALLGLNQEAAAHYRTLRQTAQAEGIDTAYRPLLSLALAYQFTHATPQDQRTLLGQRRDDLLDDFVHEALSSEPTDPKQTRLLTRARSLLHLARLNAESPALDALEDPTLFPSLLHTTARTPNLTALEATALLALTAATTEALAAEAEFHLAIVLAATSDDDEPATQTLTSACDRTPAQIPAWLTALAEIAPHHSAALTLIPHLVTRLAGTQAEEPTEAPDDPKAPHAE